MKKIIITLIFLLSFVPLVHAKTIISMTDAEGALGDEITTYLNFDNTEPFQLFGVKIKFDTSVLEFVSRNVTGFSGSMFNYAPLPEANENSLNIAIISEKKLKDKGNVAEIKFKIKSNAVALTKIELEVTDFSKDETTPLDYNTKSGTITIKNAKVDSSSKKEENNDKDDKKEETKDENTNTEETTPKKNTYTSSDPSIATIDSEGNITYIEEGNVTITKTDEDGNIETENIEVTKEMIEKQNNEEKKSKNNKIILVFLILLLVFIGILLVVKGKKK